MPQRVVNMLLAVAGLVTIAGLVVAGVNLHRAARTGPEWKRRLVSQGILLLSLMGVSIGGTGACCYMPMPPREQAIANIQRNNRALVDDLERQAEVVRQLREQAEMPEPEKVLTQLDTVEQRVEADWRTLAADLMTEAEREQAQATYDEVRAGIRQLRATLIAPEGAVDCYLMNFPLESSGGDGKATTPQPAIEVPAEPTTPGETAEPAFEPGESEPMCYAILVPQLPPADPAGERQSRIDNLRRRVLDGGRLDSRVADRLRRTHGATARPNRSQHDA